MTNLTRVPVQDVAPNPYQTRFDESPDRIATIALSIAQDGLLQPPTVRKLDAMWYQLAFGHTRTAAWKLCNDIQLGKVDAGTLSPELRDAVRNSKEDFSRMPVFIADIDDETMFRHAVTENAQRTDLSPVEEATAMKRAMEEFNYTSEQAGALFGKSGPTVRGKVRLLDLPDAARTKLHEGQISESTARGLVTLHRIAPNEVDKALADILDGDDPEDTIDFAFRKADGVTMINASHFDLKQKKFGHLPELNGEVIAKALGIEKDKRRMNCLNAAKDPADLVRMWKTSDFDSDHPLAEKLEHLIKPPVCTACPLYARADGTDYCGWKACFERKEASNMVSGLEKASQELGIGIYQEGDGETMLMDRWDDLHKRHVDKKDPDLRVMIRNGRGNNGYWSYTIGIPSYVAIVATGKLYEKCKIAAAQSAADRGQVTKDSTPELTAKVIASSVNHDVANEMMDAVLFDVFAAHLDDALAGVKNALFLGALIEAVDPDFNDRISELQGEKRSDAAEVKFRRQCVMCELVNRALFWQVKNEALAAKQPVAKLAKDVRKLAEHWGVTLGKSFDAAVADADARIHAARTEALETALAEKGIVSTETLRQAQRGAPKKGKKK